MSPVELIEITIWGTILTIFLVVLWIVFRRNKRMVVAVTICSVLLFSLFFALKPVYIKKQHTKRYTILVDYLNERYPDYEFQVTPKELENGYMPYHYQVMANGYQSRTEIFQVDRDGTVRFTSISTKEYGNQDELNDLILNRVYDQPFEYLDSKEEIEEILRHEEEDFLVRLMRVNGKVILYNYLKMDDGQYFLEQGNRSDNNNKFITMNVSLKHDENYFVLATLPGFKKEEWEKDKKTVPEIEFKDKTPAIYVVPN
ncbi:hypothetical protein ACFOZY_14250 [Chungangia koreensis]|uniref:Uncharacterized protein n=1 Tax=Chungangia koreensis TaxID=752657 RepID=A0ABV8X809_9LACT